MMRVISLLLVIQSVAVVGVSRAAVYTDETAWRNAVGNLYALETFDAIAAGSDVSQLPALGISFDPLNDGTQPTVQPYSSTGGMPRSQPHNLLNDRDFALPGRGPYNMRPIDANDLLFGVGLWNVGGDDKLRMTFFDENDAPIEVVESASGQGFFGIVNALGADRIEIDFVGGNGYAPVDDLHTAVRQTFNPTIPEPSTLTIWSLLGAAVGVGAWRRRRRR